MSAHAVLHVTSLPGGGVDRHIRDIARHGTRRHLVWHTTDGADVIEIPAEGRFLPLDRAALERDPRPLAEWLGRQGVGIVHAHSVARAPRSRASWASRSLGLAIIATLHDVLFLRPDGFEPGAPQLPDGPWLEATSAFLKGAAARIAPSTYLAELATRHVGGLAFTVIPNGSSAPPARGPESRAHPAFLARRPARIAAVLGAIGPHKGARVLEEAARLLEGSDIGIVVIGYLDVQVEPGWRGERLFVHGPYDDGQAGTLLAAYGAELALFPNQVPEAFSYSLSDAWAAGLPALVSPEGALGERVRRFGGGWLLPAGFGAHEVATELRRRLSPAGSAELTRVKSQLSRPDPQRVPALADMTRSLEALYARYGIDPRTLDTQSAPAQELLAKNLDGALFRHELSKLAEEMAQLRAASQAELGAAREWIAKLEGDVAAVQAQLAAEVAQRRRLGGENEQMRIHKEAFDLLPAIARKWLIKKILDARS
ncbi:MAG: glycosyltransferase [Usitatibacter sp.]